MATAIALKSIIHFESDAWIRPSERIPMPAFSWQEWAERFEQMRSLQNLEKLYAKRIQPQSNTDVTFQMEAVLKQISTTMDVNIPRPSTVRDYLLRYSDITNLIPHICYLIRKHFGKGTSLSLEVYRDQEIEDEYLALYVRQDHYDEHIMDNIEKVCVEYETILSGKSGWFIVTSDFRPPR